MFGVFGVLRGFTLFEPVRPLPWRGLRSAATRDLTQRGINMSKYGSARTFPAGAAIIALAGCGGSGAGLIRRSAWGSVRSSGASRGLASSVAGATRLRKFERDLELLRVVPLGPAPGRRGRHPGLPDHRRQHQRKEQRLPHEQDRLGRANLGRMHRSRCPKPPASAVP